MAKNIDGLLVQKHLKNKTKTLENSIQLYKTLIFAGTFFLMSSGYTETNKDSKAGAVLPTVEQHPPHEHGAANLTIAVDSNNIEIDLESPSDNIFGFEYLPTTEGDKEKLKNAVKQLKAAKTLFSIPEKAQCHLVEVNVVSAQLESLNADKSNKKKPDEHAHNDVDASWNYSCKSMPDLESITPHFFSVFSPRFKHLKVEWLTPSGVSSKSITEDTIIKLKGNM